MDGEDILSKDKLKGETMKGWMERINCINLEDSKIDPRSFLWSKFWLLIIILASVEYLDQPT